MIRSPLIEQRSCQERGAKNLESSRGDRDAVLELDSPDDTSEVLVAVQLPPCLLGLFIELVGHCEANGCASRTPRSGVVRAALVHSSCVQPLPGARRAHFERLSLLQERLTR